MGKKQRPYTCGKLIYYIVPIYCEGQRHKTQIACPFDMTKKNRDNSKFKKGYTSCKVIPYSTGGRNCCLPLESDNSAEVLLHAGRQETFASESHTLACCCLDEYRYVVQITPRLNDWRQRTDGQEKHHMVHAYILFN